MFHYFFNDDHPNGQGAISADEFIQIIEYIGRDNLLSAPDWLQRRKEKRLSPNHYCLTFDDNLRCQYDVAFPVMESLGITGFWFVHTNPLEGAFDKLGVYRHFRNSYFEEPDEFYEKYYQFLFEVEDANDVKTSMQAYNSTYLSEYPFYTENDKKFRFLRDEILGIDRYEESMDRMIGHYAIDLQELHSKLWMTKECIQDLYHHGHLIGLHSHTHPTNLKALAYTAQLEEYQKNSATLEAIIKDKVICMSHPCNSYNQTTLEILTKKNIVIGFRDNMRHIPTTYAELEIPRENHINLLNRIQA
jgi:peptidoglycan/xylan/chitin deacetylase (PgdA/CDA1 family)